MAYSSSSEYRDIEMKDPIDFKYRKPYLPSMSIQTYERVLTPELQLYTTKGNKIIKFRIPNDSIYDFTESMFTGVVEVLSDGVPVDANPAYCRLCQGAWNIFERQRHTQDNDKLEERQNNFDIENVSWVFEQDPNVQNSVGTGLLGIGLRSERDAWATAPKRYAFPIDLGLITSGPFPAKFLKETHIIELHLNDPLVSIESNCGNFEIRISNLEWVVSCFKNGPCGSQERLYEDSLRAYVNSGNYKVTYDSYNVFQNAVTQSQHDLPIAHRAKSLQEVLTVFQNLSDRYNPLVNDRLMTFPRHNLLTYQFKLNNTFWPETPVPTDAGSIRDYRYYLNYVNSWRIKAIPDDPQDAATVDYESYKNDEFVIVGDFKHLRDESILNELNTAKHNQDMILQLRFSAPPPSGTAAMHYMCFSTVARIDGNGSTKFCIEE